MGMFKFEHNQDTMVGSGHALSLHVQWQRPNEQGRMLSAPIDQMREVICRVDGIYLK